MLVVTALDSIGVLVLSIVSVTLSTDFTSLGLLLKTLDLKPLVDGSIVLKTYPYQLCKSKE